MASGQDLQKWTSADAIPPTSNFPGLVSRNGHLVLAFDGGTQESCDFQGELPDNYAGGGLTERLTALAASATTGTCVFEGAIERDDGATDLDADSFASFQAGTSGTVPGTAGFSFAVTITYSSGANMDSLAAGEPFRHRLRRAPANASDTITTDIQIKNIRLRET